MSKKRTFISFDYDHDARIKDLLIGQSRYPDSPFEITDMSIKQTIKSDWMSNARTRIKGCNVVIVICGEYTNTASGVSAEVKIVQEEKIPYFLLKGYSEKICTKPTQASSDKMYNWTWDNLKVLINGGR